MMTIHHSTNQGVRTACGKACSGIQATRLWPGVTCRDCLRAAGQLQERPLPTPMIDAPARVRATHVAMVRSTAHGQVLSGCGVRAAIQQLPDEYKSTCEGGTGGPCTQPDCDTCWNADGSPKHACCDGTGCFVCGSRPGDGV